MPSYTTHWDAICVQALQILCSGKAAESVLEERARRYRGIEWELAVIWPSA